MNKYLSYIFIIGVFLFLLLVVFYVFIPLIASFLLWLVYGYSMQEVLGLWIN